jgi:hypothetical protein
MKKVTGCDLTKILDELKLLKNYSLQEQFLYICH